MLYYHVHLRLLHVYGRTVFGDIKILIGTRNSGNSGLTIGHYYCCLNHGYFSRGEVFCEGELRLTFSSSYLDLLALGGMPKPSWWVRQGSWGCSDWCPSPGWFCLWGPFNICNASVPSNMTMYIPCIKVSNSLYQKQYKVFHTTSKTPRSHTFKFNGVKLWNNLPNEMCR